MSLAEIHRFQSTETRFAVLAKGIRTSYCCSKHVLLRKKWFGYLDIYLDQPIIVVKQCKNADDHHP